MSSDEESRNHLQRVASSKIQVQDFQALILPPVPVARGPNAQHAQHQHQQQHNTHTHTHTHSQSQSQSQTHSHSPEVSRRPVMTMTRSQHSNSSEPYPKPSNKGGVRGRVTVVCAEVRYSPFLFKLFPFISRRVLIISDVFHSASASRSVSLLSALTLIFHVHVLASV